MADGDRIRAVIRGFAVNNDGSTKMGYMAPSIDGQALEFAKVQEQFMASALRECQLDADTCQIEGATYPSQ